MTPQKKIVLLFIILEIIFSGILVYNTKTDSEICAPGFDCLEVQNSQYSYFLGIKLSTLGLVSFTALLIIYLLSLKYKHIERLYLASVILGTTGAIYFLYIQAFILKAFCSTCVTIDLLMIIIFIFALYDLKTSKHR